MFFRRVRPLFLLIAWLLACGIAILYIKTAYQSSRGFQYICLVEFILAFTLSFANTKWRFVLAGFAIAALPRLPSLILQAQLHNVLFPLFLGLAFGRLIRSFHGSLQKNSNQGLQTHAGYFTIAFVLLLLSASIWSIFQYTSFEELLSNRVLGPDMTSHYAVFLSTTLALNLIAPLLWIACERAVHVPGEFYSLAVGSRVSALEPMSVSRHVCLGVTLGAVAYVLVALLQNIEFVNAGITDRAMEAGRRPGLFSDSGASGVMVCSVLMMACIWILPNRRTFSALLFLLLFCLIMPFQGRVIWLALGGILVVLPFCFKQLHLSPRPLIVVLFLLALTLIVLLVLKKNSSLDTDFIFEAMQRIDPARPLLLDWSLDIFWESPLVGHGLNSFIPQLMELKQIAPGVYPENSPGIVPGLLNDVGILGFLLVVLLLGRYLRLLSQSMGTPAFADTFVRALVFLPMALAPTFLIGYHILHPEVAAWILFPLLIVPPSR